MNRSQKLAIAAIIFIPVIIGGILTASNKFLTGNVSVPGMGKKIAIVRIDDEIMESDDIVDQLKSYLEDNTIAGVVLRVNSPGGAVAPSQEIFRMVLRYRAENKPVIVSMGSMAASGGYYIAAAGQRIFANPGTITGSIGVIFRLPKYYKLMEKVGVDVQNIKSGKFKDSGSPYREFTTDERDMLQGLVDDTYITFVGDVAAARNLGLDSLKKIADGRILTGTQALRHGLIDTLGTYEEALAYTKELCHLSSSARTVEEVAEESWEERLFGSVVRPVKSMGRVVFGKGTFFLLE